MSKVHVGHPVQYHIGDRCYAAIIIQAGIFSMDDFVDLVYFDPEEGWIQKDNIAPLSVSGGIVGWSQIPDKDEEGETSTCNPAGCARGSNIQMEEIKDLERKIRAYSKQISDRDEEIERKEQQIDKMQGLLLGYEERQNDLHEQMDRLRRSLKESDAIIAEHALRIQEYAVKHRQLETRASSDREQLISMASQRVGLAKWLYDNGYTLLNGESEIDATIRAMNIMHQEAIKLARSHEELMKIHDWVIENQPKPVTGETVADTAVRIMDSVHVMEDAVETAYEKLEERERELIELTRTVATYGREETPLSRKLREKLAAKVEEWDEKRRRRSTLTSLDQADIINALRVAVTGCDLHVLDGINQALNGVAIDPEDYAKPKVEVDEERKAELRQKVLGALEAAQCLVSGSEDVRIKEFATRRVPYVETMIEVALIGAEAAGLDELKRMVAALQANSDKPPATVPGTLIQHTVTQEDLERGEIVFPMEPGNSESGTLKVKLGYCNCNTCFTMREELGLNPEDGEE